MVDRRHYTPPRSIDLDATWPNGMRLAISLSFPNGIEPDDTAVVIAAFADLEESIGAVVLRDNRRQALTAVSHGD